MNSHIGDIFVVWFLAATGARISELVCFKVEHVTLDYLFLNRNGMRITPRGISQQLKRLAERYELDKKVIYPHSFRHLYAKNFLGSANFRAFKLHVKKGTQLTLPGNLHTSFYSYDSLFISKLNLLYRFLLPHFHNFTSGLLPVELP